MSNFNNVLIHVFIYNFYVAFLSGVIIIIIILSFVPYLFSFSILRTSSSFYVILVELQFHLLLSV